MNTLPLHLRQCDSLAEFKRLLKTGLLGSSDLGALIVTLALSALLSLLRKPLTYLLTYLLSYSWLVV